MGLLDKLLSMLGKSVRKDKNKDAGKVAVRSSQPSSAQTYAPQQRGTFTMPQLKAHFDEILKSAFYDCEIRENVLAEEINAGSAGCGYRNYDYVLYKGGKPAAAVMLTLAGHRYNRPYLGAKEMSVSAGVLFYNFYTNYPNDREYVVNRIKGGM
jgi:hypothetical protein